MPFIDVITAFTILDNPMDSTIMKLSRVWHLHDHCGDGLSSLDTALATLSSCCISEVSRRAVEKTFKQHFRPMCYSMSLRAQQPSFPLSNICKSEDDSTRSSGYPEYFSTSTPKVADVLYRPTTSLESYRRDHHIKDQQRSRASTADASLVGSGNRAGSISPWMSHGVASVHPYSICESFLTGSDTFLDILLKCPSVLQLFETQLSDRIAQCYGRDERYPPLKTAIDKVIAQDADKDFSWILKTKSSKLV